MTIDPRYDEVYAQMAPFTVTPHAGYVTNLLLAESVKDVPGAIVECGVWRGGLIAGIALLFGDVREYWLFDSFKGLPPVEDIDGTFAKTWVNDPAHDHFKVPKAVAIAAMELAGVSTYHVVEGWFHDTLPHAVFDEGIAFLRIDADWYTPMLQCLEALFPQVNTGGVVSIDDYYFLEGAAKATHRYLADHDLAERIEVITDAESWAMPTDGVVYIRKG